MVVEGRQPQGDAAVERTGTYSQRAGTAIPCLGLVCEWDEQLLLISINGKVPGFVSETLAGLKVQC